MRQSAYWNISISGFAGFSEQVAAFRFTLAEAIAGGTDRTGDINSSSSRTVHVYIYISHSKNGHSKFLE